MIHKKLEAREYNVEEIMGFSDSQWLVDSFVEVGSCIFVSAQPKVGKSFFALRLATAVSSGTDLFGYEAKQGHVLYLAAERSNLMKRRIQALTKRGLSIEAANFRMWPEPVMFANHVEVRTFVKSLKQIPSLLIVDTLRRCNDGDERDNNHMGQWTKGIELFRDLTGATVVVVHHDHRHSFSSHGRKLESSFSGAGAILGNLDGYFSIRPQTNGTIVIESEGSNELNEFHVTTRIENVLIGYDLQGRPLSSGVMVQVDENGAIEEKPSLWPIAREVLQLNPRISQTEWRHKCLQNPIVVKWWPELSKATLSVIANEHADEILVEKQGTSNLCSLVALELEDVA